MKKNQRDIQKFLQRVSTAKARERPAVVSGAPVQVPHQAKSSQIISPDQVALGESIVPEKVSNMERILNTHICEDTDQLFDISAIISAFVFPAAVNQEANILTYPVPVGQRLVIQNYHFFGLINNAPVNPYYILADPIELSWFFAFRIKSNQTTSFIQHTQVQLVAGVAPGVFHYLFACTENNHINDPPDPLGTHVVIPGGQNLMVDVVRLQLGAPPRTTDYMGVRLKGFITSEYQGKAEARQGKP